MSPVPAYHQQVLLEMPNPGSSVLLSGPPNPFKDGIVVVAGFKPCQDMCIADQNIETVSTDSVETCMKLCYYAEGVVCMGIEFFGVFYERDFQLDDSLYKLYSNDSLVGPRFVVDRNKCTTIPKSTNNPPTTSNSLTTSNISITMTSFKGALSPGDSVWSPNGQYQLRYGDDGNLVLYHHQGNPLPIWSSGTYCLAGGVAGMQDDGNLVVRDNSCKAIWSSQTWGNYGAQLELNDDGSLVYH
ncbi:hypothetical protein THAOC_20543 [Thalassiosira oceanica]|uniref:Bulb-type lectin domain-containing protein n=1 Tax=Thalassiosira oceanica TaxID=159749 RepID=K0S229_THAOC|nr:hypothetical protein THAOC_20543 [Thalassiosira oceanica]|eukprot:EJK59260.1 hypothetical protein THAOC_20543 [Thalassiosira oceanica]